MGKGKKYRKKMKTQEEMLIMLALNNIVSKTALLTVKKNHTTVYDAVRELKENGWISEEQIPYKKRSRRKMFNSLAITSEGLNHLRDISKEYRLDSYSYWVKFLPDDPVKIRLYESGYGSERIMRHIELAGASVIAHEIRAAYVPVFIGDAKFKIEDEDISANVVDVFEEMINKRTSSTNAGSPAAAAGSTSLKEKPKSIFLKDLVMMGVELSEPVPLENGFKYLNASAPIRFTNSKVIKSVIRRSEQDDRPMMYCRYAGLFESPNRTLICYMAPQNGFGWRRWIVDNEISSVKHYLAIAGYYEQRIEGWLSAVLFVDNAKMFVDIMEDVEEKRTEREMLGDRMESLFIFPLTYEGIQHFNLLLDTDKSYLETIFSQAVESGYYKKNEGELQDLFPLLSNDNIPVYNGIFIDVWQLQTLISYTESIADFDYKILCLPWQIDFYYRLTKPINFDSIVL